MPQTLAYLGDFRDFCSRKMQALLTTGPANRILVAVIVVPLAINGALLVGYLGATGQRGTLASEFRDIESKIQLSAPGTATAGASVILPKEMESADLMDMLIRTAQDSTVELVGVDSLGATPQRVDGKSYKAFRYRVQIRARVSQLVAFLNRLEQAQQNVLLVGDLTGSPKSGQAWQVSVDLLTFVADKAPTATPTVRGS